jgi:hypothetical protein
MYSPTQDKVFFYDKKATKTFKDLENPSNCCRVNSVAQELVADRMIFNPFLYYDDEDESLAPFQTGRLDQTKSLSQWTAGLTGCIKWCL